MLSQRQAAIRVSARSVLTSSVTWSIPWMYFPPERVRDVHQLDPKKYGIIVQSGHRRGLLLPDLEGVDTVADQLRITRMKAGILPSEAAEILSFTVTRYK